MSTVRRFISIGGFKDDVLYIEHVDGKSHGIIKEDFSNAYPLSTCERLVNKGEWEEIPTDAQLNREGTMTELERTKEALAVALRGLKAAGHEKAYAKCCEILNPAPIIEEVEEVVGWVNVYQRADGSVYVGGTACTSKEEADSCSCGNRISCQPIKVKVQREKPLPVERSANGTVCVNAYPTNSTHIAVDCPIPYGTECVVTWTEDPTT